MNESPFPEFKWRNVDYDDDDDDEVWKRSRVECKPWMSFSHIHSVQGWNCGHLPETPWWAAAELGSHWKRLTK